MEINKNSSWNRYSSQISIIHVHTNTCTSVMHTIYFLCVEKETFSLLSRSCTQNCKITYISYSFIYEF